MNAPRRPTLPQWKIDLVREAIKIIEGEKGRRVTAAMIARRIPSFSMADIEIAMELLEAQQGRERGRARRLGGVRLKLALPRQLPKPASNRIDRYDCEYKQQSDHNHWNADEIQRGGSGRALAFKRVRLPLYA